MSGMTNQRGYSRRTFLKAAAGATGDGLGGLRLWRRERLRRLRAACPQLRKRYRSCGGVRRAAASATCWRSSWSTSTMWNPGVVVQDEYQGDYIETMNKVIAAAATAARHAAGG